MLGCHDTPSLLAHCAASSDEQQRLCVCDGPEGGYACRPPDQPQEELGELMGYPFIPSIPAGLSRLEQKAGALLDKLNSLPLDQTVENANDALENLDGALASLNKILDTTDPEALPADLQNTLAQLRAALAGLSPDSPLYRRLTASLGELNRTLSNLEVLTRTLSDQPNAIVLPVELPPDPTPEAQ